VCVCFGQISISADFNSIRVVIYACTFRKTEGEKSPEVWKLLTGQRLT